MQTRESYYMKVYDPRGVAKWGQENTVIYAFEFYWSRVHLSWRRILHLGT